MSKAKILDMVKKWPEEFDAYFKALITKSEVATINLCAINLVETRDLSIKNEALPEFAWFIIEAYSDNVLFPSEYVTDALKKLDFTEHETRWFTPANKILELFQTVSNKGKFVFHPVATLELVRLYVMTKIIDTILKFYGFTGSVYHRKTNLAEVALHKFLIRSKTRKTNRMSVVDLEMNQMFAEAMHIAPDFLKKIEDLPKHARGKVEKIFIGELFRLITSNPEFPEKETGLNEKYRAFYPLAQLIFKDEHLYTEEEFKKINNSRKTDMYDGDFDKYIIERLKRILAK
jgi:hypothetical protein